MFFFWMFFVELLVLFFLSQQLTKSLSFLFFSLTKSERWTIRLLAILFIPGTILHELAHLFMAVILFVPVGTMEFIPKVHGQSVKLGSVSIGKTDPFRRALIGLAPLLVGLTLLFFSIGYFTGLPFQPWYLNIFFLTCIIFEIGNTMFSSRRDIEGIPTLLVTVILIGILLYVFGVRIPQQWINFLFSLKTISFFQQIVWYMLLPLGLDGGILLLSRIKGR